MTGQLLMWNKDGKMLTKLSYPCPKLFNALDLPCRLVFKTGNVFVDRLHVFSAKALLFLLDFEL